VSAKLCGRLAKDSYVLNHTPDPRSGTGPAPGAGRPASPLRGAEPGHVTRQDLIDRLGDHLEEDLRSNQAASTVFGRDRATTKSR